MILVGTSGFSFEDWRGTVYPEVVSPSQFLKYYWAVLGFRIVELNFTYYTRPSWKSFAQMLRKTPPDFYFTVKVPGEITHAFWKAREDPSQLVRDFSVQISPLVEEGRFKCALAQFPFSFKYSKENLDYLGRVRSTFSGALAFEFRHASWDREETYEFLREHDITFVAVDEPSLPNLFPYKPLATSDLAYFRFHGRNQKWFEVEGDERYNYLYSDEELLLFKEDILKLSRMVRETYVFFNNCYQGQAVRNAQTLLRWLEGRS